MSSDQVRVQMSSGLGLMLGFGTPVQNPLVFRARFLRAAGLRGFGCRRCVESRGLNLKVSRLQDPQGLNPTWRFMGSYKGSFQGPFKGIYRGSIRVYRV